MNSLKLPRNVFTPAYRSSNETLECTGSALQLPAGANCGVVVSTTDIEILAS